MLAGQIFEFSDLGKVALLVVLEALLSADNALILAIIVRHLPKDQQKKALFYGLAGAFVLRFGAILLATHILSFWWLQVIGALYLLYLPTKHFIRHSQGGGGHRGAEGAGFWMTVIYADLADLAFAIDSVLVAVAVVQTPSKVWIVYAGAFLGIILLRFAANWCLRLLERYPVMDHVAYALVGWAGVKLLLVGGETYVKWHDEANPTDRFAWTIPHMHPAVFWGGMVLIVVVGIVLALRHPAPDPARVSEIEEAEAVLEESQDP